MSDLPAEQGETSYRVGPGNPPRECQCKPGQSGNPNGSPRARTNLWPTLCRFLGMTDAQLSRVAQRKNLRQVEHVALKIASQLREGVPRRGIGALIEHFIERDEGKPSQTVQLHEEDALSAEECEEIRQELQRRSTS